MENEIILLRSMRTALKTAGASDDDAARIAHHTLHKLRVRNLERSSLGAGPLGFGVALQAAATVYARERVAADLTRRRVEKIGQPHRKQ